jgi:hypothetical protein
MFCRDTRDVIGGVTVIINLLKDENSRPNAHMWADIEKGVCLSHGSAIIEPARTQIHASSNIDKPCRLQTFLISYYLNK